MSKMPSAGARVANFWLYGTSDQHQSLSKLAANPAILAVTLHCDLWLGSKQFVTCDKARMARRARA
jgi:hypothetical protein